MSSSSLVCSLESEFESSLALTERVVSLVSSGGNPSSTLATLVAVEEEVDVAMADAIKGFEAEQKLRANLIKLVKELESEFDKNVLPLLKSSSEAVLASFDGFAKEQEQQSKGVRTVEKSTKLCNEPKSVGAKSREVFAAIEMLTVSEFESTPKYVRGRLTYEMIKTCLSEMNQLLQSKYAFLSKGFQSHGSLKDKKKYKELRAQETAETAGRCFILTSDLANSKGFMRTEAGRRAVVGVLRHNKRIKEIRANMGASKLVVINEHL